ncbi:MAG: hypothetical protein K6T91_09150 [Firmicutes bacterium]|nr:hypothetical protein [Bacillota bacterium]
MRATILTPNYGVKKITVAITIALLLFVSIFLQVGIDAERGKMELEMTHVKSTASTTLKLLGGLRSVAAAYIWLKVDRLHDNYYGALNEKEDELIPLYRLTTWLDPHIVDAYYVGSYLLYKVKRPDEGWEFALEGLNANPDSAEMELNVGQLALFYKNDYRLAISHLERAYLLSESDADKFVALKGLEVAYKKAGMLEKAETARQEASKLKGSI